MKNKLTVLASSTASKRSVEKIKIRAAEIENPVSYFIRLSRIALCTNAVDHKLACLSVTRFPMSTGIGIFDL